MSALQLQSGLGLVAFAVLAWALGTARGRLRPRALARLAIAGLGLQIAVALLLLKLPPAQSALLALNDAVGAILAATRAGTSFVFGYLGGAPLPFEAKGPGGGFVLALQALPIILVVSALSAVLYHWRILPLLVRALSRGLQRTMGVGGAVGVSTAANIFLGMVEAPLLVRPYLARLTRSELFVVMTGGMASVAGTVMVLYASILGPAVSNAIGHILVASLISAPAAILVGILMEPDERATDGAELGTASPYRSTMDAVVEGTQQGLTLLLSVVAMLIVFVALVALANAVLAALPDVLGGALTLQRMLGWLCAPVAWTMGIPWEQAAASGALIGTKTVLNEFVAYVELAALPDGTLDARSRLIMVYALCGFANLGSLGIMIGGLAAMAPERRAEITALGLRSILSGTIATCMTGAVVGLLTPP
ncbi:MAG: nucleoside:proton symporter [Alphaproteobacteria bacterium]|nr:nucleoside:proton symporter [Alphaproteobacteria bacterium]